MGTGWEIIVHRGRGEDGRMCAEYGLRKCGGVVVDEAIRYGKGRSAGQADANVAISIHSTGPNISA
jgi:hypothetical protein